MQTAFITLALTVVLLPGCRKETTFPNRPITIICPWSAGGGTDRVSRQIAIGLEKQLGVPVNVVNATGGGGVTGHSRGALARPNGYVLTTITPELTMLHWRGMTNVTFRDFQPLMSVNGDDAALFVRSDSSLRSIEAMAQAIQDRPGTIKASGSAFGSIWHIALAGWLTSMKLSPTDVIWVSVNGSAPSLQELMAGTVDLVCCSVPEAQTLLDAKKIRCIATMGQKEPLDLPGVPNLKSKGYNWSLSGWRGVALPKGAPPERADRILSALKEVVNGSEYRDFLKQAGFGHRAGGPEEFTETLKDSDEKFGQIFQSEAFVSVQKQRYGPMLFPGALGCLISIVLLSLVATGQWRRDPSTAVLTTEVWLRVLILLGAILFYVLAAEALGFILTAALILLGLFSVLKVKWIVAIPVTVGLVGAVYQLFAVLLRVPLPWGLFGW